MRPLIKDIVSGNFKVIGSVVYPVGITKSCERSLAGRRTWGGRGGNRPSTLEGGGA